MSHYTPTTEEVRRNFRQNISESYGVEVDGAFDRWLAQHNAEVASATEQRIIKLLEDNAWQDEFGNWLISDERDALTALIKGESK